MGKGKVSAGFVMYRRKSGKIEFLLAHPGGPYWASKDDGVWHLPKGQPEEDEGAFEAALREFEEETSVTPREPYIDLGTAKQKNGKTVFMWAFERDADPESLKSNLCEIEWPPRSGKTLAIPENDRFGFFSREEAEIKGRPDHLVFLDRLVEKLDAEH